LWNNRFARLILSLSIIFMSNARQDYPQTSRNQGATRHDYLFARAPIMTQTTCTGWTASVLSAALGAIEEATQDEPSGGADFPSPIALQ
jgi:hypothetical protein